jgi:hypothetical protein
MAAANDLRAISPSLNVQRAAKLSHPLAHAEDALVEGTSHLPVVCTPKRTFAEVYPLLRHLVNNAAGAQLLQELLPGHEQRVLVEDAADDEHRMGTPDVNENPSAKLGEIVGSDDRGMVAPPRARLGLVLQESSHTDSRFQGPFHMGDKPRVWEPLLSSVCNDRLDQRTHPVLVKVAITQMCLCPGAQLELAALLCGGRIDPGRRQALEVGVTSRGIDDMTRHPLAKDTTEQERCFTRVMQDRIGVGRCFPDLQRETYMLTTSCGGVVVRPCCIAQQH